MKVTYFQETDTLHITLRTDSISEVTRELNENVYIDLDKDGKVVAVTIEHAGAMSEQPLFSYETVSAD